MRNRRLLNAIFAIALAAALPGCLSLGGKTVYTTDSPETSDRIAALEKRVSALEAVTGTRPPVPPSAPIGH